MGAKTIQECPEDEPSRRRCQHTQQLSSLQRSGSLSRGKNDETEEPIYVFEKSHSGSWVREEADVHSGAVACVTRKKEKVKQTEAGR